MPARPHINITENAQTYAPFRNPAIVSLFFGEATQGPVEPALLQTLDSTRLIYGRLDQSRSNLTHGIETYLSRGGAALVRRVVGKYAQYAGLLGIMRTQGSARDFEMVPYPHNMKAGPTTNWEASDGGTELTNNYLDGFSENQDIPEAERAGNPWVTGPDWTVETVKEVMIDNEIHYVKENLEVGDWVVGRDPDTGITARHQISNIGPGYQFQHTTGTNTSFDVSNLIDRSDIVFYGHALGPGKYANRNIGVQIHSLNIDVPSGVTGRAEGDSNSELPAGTYDYRVSAWNQTGATAGAPVPVTVGQDQKAVLSWNAQDNVEGYRIYRRVGNNTDIEGWIMVGEVDKVTTFSDLNLKDQIDDPREGFPFYTPIQSGRDERNLGAASSTTNIHQVHDVRYMRVAKDDNNLPADRRWNDDLTAKDNENAFPYSEFDNDESRVRDFTVNVFDARVARTSEQESQTSNIIVKQGVDRTQLEISQKFQPSNYLQFINTNFSNSTSPDGSHPLRTQEELLELTGDSIRISQTDKVTWMGGGNDGKKATESEYIAAVQSMFNKPRYRYQLIVQNGVPYAGFRRKIVELAESNKFGIALLDIPVDKTEIGTVIRYRESLNLNTSRAALYSGAFRIIDSDNAELYIPASAVAAGVFVNNFILGNAASSPAGTRRGIVPSDVVQELKYDYSPEEQQRLADNHVNYFIDHTTYGVTLQTAYTLNRDNEALQYITSRQVLDLLALRTRVELEGFLHENYTSDRVTDAVQAMNRVLQEFIQQQLIFRGTAFSPDANLGTSRSTLNIRMVISLYYPLTVINNEINVIDNQITSTIS